MVTWEFRRVKEKGVRGTPCEGPSAGGLDPAAEHLGDAPGLGHAAARGVGRLAVEHLADGAAAGMVQLADRAPSVELVDAAADVDTVCSEMNAIVWRELSARWRRSAT